MKDQFIGFYNATDEEIDKSWKDGIIAFDANTILNAYRYTEAVRKDFLVSLKTIKDRIFLPYQAAYEFHSNRLTVIKAVESAYTNIEETLKDNLEKQLKQQINKYKQHPVIDLDNIYKLHEEFLKKVNAELKKQKDKQPDFFNDNKVLDEITELFTGKVGKAFEESQLAKIYEEGKIRYAKEIPPGYKDEKEKKSKGDQHVYGDLIVWKELIRHGKDKQQPIIFVTDDRKEDWWRKEGGETIRPREELIKEFFDETKIRILIYNADQFLRLAKERDLIPNVKRETIEAIEATRKKDEKYTIWNIPDYNLYHRDFDMHRLDELNTFLGECKKVENIKDLNTDYLDLYENFKSQLFENPKKVKKKKDDEDIDLIHAD